MSLAIDVVDGRGLNNETSVIYSQRKLRACGMGGKAFKGRLASCVTVIISANSNIYMKSLILLLKSVITSVLRKST